MKMGDEDVLRAQFEVLSLAGIEQNEAVHEDARVFGMTRRNAFNVSSSSKNRYKH